MIETIINLVYNFALHIQINTLNLAYSKKLPRPYKSHWISRQLRKLFETDWIKTVIGANLAMAMMAIPAITSVSGQEYFEPPLEVAQHNILITDSYTPQIHTEPTQYTNPVPNLRFVGQEFHPGHHALDLNSYVGDPVLAFAGGRVHYIEDGTLGYGRYIILDHGHGLTSLYAHLKAFHVKVGQVVEAGDQIGQIGMTGWTTGPHLHFEIYDNGVAVNPRQYLEFK